MATRDPAVDDDPRAIPEERGSTRDTRVDSYIADARPFARPILAHLRHVVHAACPDVEETIKWRMPFFVYHGNVCHMAAFKSHCAFGLWRARELPGMPALTEESAMGSFGRITSVDDLPPKRVLTSLVKAAVKLNAASVKRPRVAARPAPPLPDDLAAALAARPDAARAFEALAPSMRREYLEWIIDAKRATTRATRIATTLGKIVEGKPRQRKVETC